MKSSSNSSLAEGFCKDASLSNKATSEIQSLMYSNAQGVKKKIYHSGSTYTGNGSPNESCCLGGAGTAEGGPMQTSAPC